MAWTWTYFDADGSPLDPDGRSATTATEFPAQADAEAWVGEAWPDLVEDGVDAVTLMQDGVVEYGPMSLRPSQ